MKTPPIPAPIPALKVKRIKIDNLKVGDYIVNSTSSPEIDKFTGLGRGPYTSNPHVIWQITTFNGHDTESGWKRDAFVAEKTSVSGAKNEYLDEVTINRDEAKYKLVIDDPRILAFLI